MSSTKSEMLTEDNSKAVRLSRALCSMLEDCEHRLGTKTVSDTLDMLLRPVLRTMRKTHGSVNVSFSESVLEYSITIKFSKKETLNLRENK